MLDRTAAPRNVPEPEIALAERLFDVLKRETADTAGVTRAAYGKGEQFAHDLVAKEADLLDRIAARRNVPDRHPLRWRLLHR